MYIFVYVIDCNIENIPFLVPWGARWSSTRRVRKEFQNSDQGPMRIPDKRPPDKKPPDKRPPKMPTPDKRPHGQKTTRTKRHQAGFSMEKS